MSGKLINGDLMYTFSVEGLKERGVESHVVGQIKAMDEDAEVSLDTLNNLVKVYTTCSVEDIERVLEKIGLKILGKPQ